MLLLFIVYYNLTLTFANVELVRYVTLELSVFGALISIEWATLGLIKVELSLFKKTIMLVVTFIPFTWWADDEQQFYNISHLAQQFMGIISSQIKIERIFNMASAITSLRRC
jgi:hypothetical protein